MPPNFTPPAPGYTARFDEKIQRVVMAYLGVQYSAGNPGDVQKALTDLNHALANADKPQYWDRAEYTDEAGYINVITIAYWSDLNAYQRWQKEFGANWASGKMQYAGCGTFAEILQPDIRNFETIISSPAGGHEGVARLAEKTSGLIFEHAYWGGMRDRLPVSQVSDLKPVGQPKVMRNGDHATVIAHDDICLIRSGQDWTDTDKAQFDMYMTDVEPFLREGMEFLRDDGLLIKCYTNRFVRCVDPANGQPIKKTFGMSWWWGLQNLEDWSDSHETHLRIHKAAIAYLTALGANAKLRLYHEVSVVPGKDVTFEYYRCHPQTGMLRVALPSKL